MKIQITQKQLCEILSRSLGTTVESVGIVECKEDVKCREAGEASPIPHNPRELTPDSAYSAKHIGFAYKRRGGENSISLRNRKR